MEAIKISTKNIEDIYFLSPMQEGMLYHYQTNKDPNAYFEQVEMEIEGAFSFDYFETTVVKLMEAHPILRTTFVYEKSKRPVQAVLKNKDADISFMDISAASSAEQIQLIQDFKEKDKTRGFNLKKDTLIRFTVFKLEDNCHKIIWSHHHIILDGWCLGIVLNDMLSIYSMLKESGEAQLPYRPPYSSYIKWLGNQNANEGLQFWGNELKGFSGKTEVSLHSPQNDTQEYEELCFELDVTKTTKLKDLAAETQVSLNNILQSIWSILLQKVTLKDDIAFGSVVSGRESSIKDVENILGLFINTIPIRVKKQQDETFIELVKKIYNKQINANAYSYVNLAEVQSRTEVNGPLFDNILIFQNYPLDNYLNNEEWYQKTDFHIKSISAFEQTNYSLNVVITPTDSIEILFNYKKSVLPPERMEALKNSFLHLVSTVVENPNVKVEDIPLLSNDVEKQYSNYFLGDVSEVTEKLLHNLFEKSANDFGHRTALKIGTQTLNYRELNELSNQTARYLKNKGVQKGDYVGVILGRSVETISSILAILKLGCAFVPIDINMPHNRMNAILEDANIHHVITAEDNDATLANQAEKIVLVSDEIKVLDATNLDVDLSPGNLAYIIYTSGTTGRPKGVKVRHKNIVNTINWRSKYYKLQSEYRVLQFLSYVFDPFVANVFSSFAAGSTLVLMEEHTYNDPFAIKTTIFEEKITHVLTTPSFFSTVVEIMDSNSISSLKAITFGGEALRKSTVEQIQVINPSIEIFNEYGPTETSVIASVKKIENSDEITLGKPIENIQFYVLNQDSTIQPPYTIGELYIAGQGVAEGYVNNNSLTNEVFIDSVKYNTRMYKTGDLVEWLPNGEIVYRGRLDQQVKIRGHRIELKEIEEVILKNINIQAAYICTRKDNNQELIGYYVCKDNVSISPEDILKELRLTLPGVMVPTYLVSIPTLPLKNSGKVDDALLPEPQVVEQKNEVFNSQQELLCEIWKDTLGLDLIGLHDDFFKIGGHSLKAMSVVTQVFNRMKISLPIQIIFDFPTIFELSRYIDDMNQNEVEEKKIPEASSADGYYRITPQQESIYISTQLDSQSISYNMPVLMKVDGVLDVSKLENVLNQLLERHEILRTIFEVKDNLLYQRVLDKVTITIEQVHHEDYSLDNVYDYMKQWIRSFDLENGPLLRATYLHAKDAQYVLFDIHHMIADGFSIELLLKEWSSLYNGKQLNSAPVQYKDYSIWHINNLENNPALKEYWLTEMQGDIPVLDMPYDFNRPAVQSYSGNRIMNVVSTEQLRKLKEWAKSKNSTVYTTLLAAYNILLSKYSGQEDIIVGTPILGRQEVGLEQTVGMFVNTLAIRTNVSGDQDFESYFKNVADKVISSSKHQSFPFAELIKALGLEGQTNHHPLFSTMFTYQEEFHSTYAFDSFIFERQSTPFMISKFDFTLTGYEKDNQLYLECEYNTDLFDAKTIETMLNRFKVLLNTLLENPKSSISNISLLTTQDANEIEEFTMSDTVGNTFISSINDLFVQSVEQHSLNIALQFEEKQWTYAELNEQSNRVAGLLQRNGVTKGDVVTLISDRSEEMIISLLAILKAGATYVPIEASTPKERMNYIIEDSCSDVVLITTSDSMEGLSATNVIRLKDVDLLDGYEYKYVNVSSEDLAYIIYTSGTTGHPKGTLIKQKNVVDTVVDTNYISFEPSDNILQLSSFMFDGSIFDIFGALLNGATLKLIHKDIILNSYLLGEFIENEQITKMFITTSLFNVLVESCVEKLSGVEKILFGGEKASKVHVEKAFKFLGKDRLIHMYGPTENTVYTTWYPINSLSESSRIPIGKPINKSELYILDRHMQLQPVGIPGELYIGGSRLSNGYLRKPVETEKAFIQSPFNANEILYKTGDIVRWLESGDLEYIDRVDKQVKVRGFRIELKEIEQYILQHPLIKEAAVHVTGKGESANLICFYVTDKKLTIKDLKMYLTEYLPEYMIPMFYKKVEEIKLTSNGKVDYAYLLSLDVDSYTQDEFKAPTTETENQLERIWKEILTFNESISVNWNFFELGGNSLKASMMLGRLLKDLELKVTLQALFQHPTIEELAYYLNSLKQENKKLLNIQPAIPKDLYETSMEQKRMYLAWELDKNSTTYNVPKSIKLIGKKIHFENAIKTLVQRHESLRTVFVMENDSLKQRIVEEITLPITYHSPQNQVAKDTIKKDFIQSFDLNKGPLFRVAVIEQSNEWEVLFDFHHSIVDGASLHLLMEELRSIYNEAVLPEISLQYKDYSEWQAEFLTSEDYEKGITFWKDYLQDASPNLDLLTDFKPTLSKSYEGSRKSVVLDRYVTKKIKNLTHQTQTTLNSMLLAIYSVFLQKYTGQNDLLIGVPVGNREFQELEHVCGMFVNTLPMRLEIDENEKVLSYVQSINDVMLQAIEHRHFPLEEVLDDFSAYYTNSSEAIFNTLFSMQDTGQNQSSWEEIELGVEHNISKFNISLYVMEKGDELYFEWEYKTSLFKSETIERMAKHFINLVHNLIGNHNSTIQELELIDAQEKQCLLNEFSLVKASDLQVETIFELFNKEVTENPNRPAILEENESYTIQEFGEKINQYAHYLIENGVKPGDVVAIRAKRNIDMVTSIYAVLKLGAAYLPVNYKADVEQVKYLLEDSGSKHLITDTLIVIEQVKTLSLKLNDTDAYSKEFAGPKLNKGDTAYIIYTSGSTGKPKGVQVSHENLINLLYTLYERYQFTSNDTLLFKTAYTFDVSISEIFGWILGRTKLVVLPEGLEKDPVAVANYIEKYGITHINFAPSVLKAFLGVWKEYALEELKTVILAGEALPIELTQDICKMFPHIIIDNLYGPTEATVYATGYIVNGNEENIMPIGRPLLNMKSYVMNGYNLVPVGVMGELFIAGKGVSKGYLNREELNNNSFIDSPFVKGEKLYRTGDWVSWTSDRNLLYYGRKDKQVKVRGHRIELGEIIAQINKLPGVKDCAVNLKELEDEKYLCAYIVVDKPLNDYDIHRALSKVLPNYMIPTYYFYLEAMPLNTSGKVDHKKLDKLAISNRSNKTELQSPEEQALAAIWMDLLKTPYVDADDNFFLNGGHSLKAISLMSEINKVFSIEIGIQDIFDYPVFKDLLERINLAKESVIESISKSPTLNYYPVTQQQMRIYSAVQLNQSTVAYNMPIVLEVKGDLHLDEFEQALNKVIQRNSVLKSSFVIADDHVYMNIHDEFKISVDSQEIYDEQLHAEIDKFVRPFDLSKPGLIRARVLKTGAHKCYVLVDVHHIIMDGYSIGLLLNHLFDTLSERNTPLDYHDYSYWMYNRLQKEPVGDQKAFWQIQIGDKELAIDLPLKNLVKDKGLEGESSNFAIQMETKQEIEKFISKHNITMYHFMFAVYKLTLAKLTGKSNLTIGTVLNGRNVNGTEDMIGLFAQSIPVNTSFNFEHKVIDFITDFKEHLLRYQRNQDYPFEKVLEELSTKSESLNTMFVFQNEGLVSFDSSGIKVLEYKHENISKFDLTLTVIERQNQIALQFEFKKGLYSPEAIEKLQSIMLNMFECVLKMPNQTLNEIKLLNEQEEEKITALGKGNQESISYESIIDLFEAQVSMHPKRLALKHEDTEYTYAELKCRVDELAMYLRSFVKPKEVVGVMFDRSPEQIISFLAILQAGAIYLPLDVTYPQTRLKYMLEDSRCTLVLTDDTTLLTDVSVPVVTIDKLYQTDLIQPETGLTINQDDTAYLIYTSGT
ncbi:amino acid adenylation domain-containing protein, partial [Bacillus thuringiensis]